MISPQHEVLTVVSDVWKIPAPAVWKDVEDTLLQIRRELGEQDPRSLSDDAVMVFGREDELWFVRERR